MSSRLYNTWYNVKARCTNPKNPRYSSYGGRGVSICEEWKHSFDTFKEWALRHGYDDALSIDRIDNDGNYEPSNCRWISNREQQRNKRTNLFYTIGNETKTLTEWCEQYGVGFNTIKGRLGKGWGILEALTSPLKDKRVDITGQKYGRITVLSFAYSKNGTYWNCRCECGGMKIIRGDCLKDGSIVSCGCFHSEKVRKQ